MVDNLNRILVSFLVDITLTGRLMNISLAENANSASMDQFQYAVREYFLIIWSYLFKNGYAFEVHSQDEENTKHIILLLFRSKEIIRNSTVLTVNRIMK